MEAKFLKRNQPRKREGRGKGWWLPVFVMAGVSVLSGSAGVPTGGVTFVGMDKLGHVVVFGLLAVSVARCGDVVGRPWRSWLVAVLVAGGFGLADELHQLTNPERMFEWGDWVADWIGGLSGAGVYVRWHGLRRLLEQPVGLSGKEKRSRQEEHGGRSRD